MTNKEFFEQRGYMVLRNAFPAEFMRFLRLYLDVHIDRAIYRKSNEFGYDDEWDGSFEDDHISNSYFCHYGSTISDTMMLFVRDRLTSELGLGLNPTYSFLRVYKQGNVLPPHCDRASCEISVTAPIFFDTSNLHHEYVWPIYFVDYSGETVAVELLPGDLVVYRGIELKHWRDEFIGKYQTQLMMHYTDSSGPYRDLIFDLRTQLATKLVNYFQKE